MIEHLCRKNRDLLLPRNVTEAELERKTIHLRFRQRVGPSKFDRVLSGDDKKQVGQGPPLTIDADLSFPHRFEQGRLRARRGAVDFISQQNIGEDWPFVEIESLFALVVNRISE